MTYPNRAPQPKLIYCANCGTTLKAEYAGNGQQKIEHCGLITLLSEPDEEPED